MKTTFPLGRIFGIRVGVNWSVLIILMLVAGGLATGYLPAANPDHPFWAYALAGGVAALTFFAALLAHELAHAIVATRHGVPVEGITLWMLGGVAQLRGEARTPGDELKIAGVGPLVSLLLGFAFAGLALALALVGWTGLVFGTVVWLAVVNVALAVFNVLPAAPLDGGRLLRAALWKWRGDRAWAAVVAAGAGQFFGGLLLFLGFWQLLAGAGLGGVWLGLLGWFLISAASAEGAQARIDDQLRDVRVGDAMSPQPQTLPADMTVAELVAGYLWQLRHSAYPLTDDGRPVGLVMLDRIGKVPSASQATTRLADISVNPEDLVLAEPGDLVVRLLPRLDERSGSRVLVVEDGVLAGILTPSDIRRAVQYSLLRRGQTQVRS